MRRYTGLLSGFFFVASFALVALALVEKVANAAGYTVVGSAFEPSRLLEFAAISLLFVVALLLRDIRSVLEADATR